ncbi:hypothetical protein AB0L82_35875 [Nocardia sp. NPDC052001]|uniref:hypothetical protein n=1 Tax=Nocardia sp. NPDC052001 TaxID=3154853 RepID=UPI00341A50B8
MFDIVQGVADSNRRRYRPIYMVDGVVVPPGELVRSGDRYVEPQLARCENGHILLRPGSALIGWISCPVPGVRGGHRLTRCRQCAVIDYRPPLDQPLCACQQRARRMPPQ